METKHSFLFVTWEGGGNVPPVLGLASRLIKRGHRVRILTEPCLKDAVGAIGAEYREFKTYFTRTDPTIDIIQDWNASPLTIPTIDNVLVRPAMDVARETQAALNEEPTDVVVADLMMVGSLIAAEAMNIKRVALFHMPEYLPGPGRPPGGLGLRPLSSSLGRLRDKLLAVLFYRIINQYLPPLNAVRGAFSLPLLASVDDIYHQADLRLIQTSKAFDAPITPAPGNVRYVGPILDDPFWTDVDEALGPERDSRPFVVVGLSSTFQNQRAVLERIIHAVSGMDIRCLVTLGPSMARESFQGADNVRIVSSIPHSRVFPHADAVVTHAGHGTVMRALASGLPLVCLPMGRDQIDNAALVAHHGAGLTLKPKARVNHIRKAIKRVLDEPGFGRSARSLQKSILADSKADLAVSQLEHLVISRGNGARG
ncbi:N-glycosyltransferase [Desulfoluna limicola]|uniref:N-glycosyltransferase n=1 Tax=Desulfoluna limicola TaxID=2810562 RepID=A0ABN6F376_9BACT|nr:glycosyltransferase [Desulfoluna limicola]BCS95675.1 N-glycosyltransferase [Desulfoluna limicola]